MYGKRQCKNRTEYYAIILNSLNEDKWMFTETVV